VVAAGVIPFHIPFFGKVRPGFEHSGFFVREKPSPWLPKRVKWNKILTVEGA
jgi:hypothetical protein